jgi:hypothetical protein
VVITAKNIQPGDRVRERLGSVPMRLGSSFLPGMNSKLATAVAHDGPGIRVRKVSTWAGEVRLTTHLGDLSVSANTRVVRTPNGARHDRRRSRTRRSWHGSVLVPDTLASSHPMC